MDINSNSLTLFNNEGLSTIEDSIINEFERLIEEDYFEEDQQNFKKELLENLDKFGEDMTEYELLETLTEVVNWLNKPDNMEAFGSEGWEHACGLDYI